MDFEIPKEAVGLRLARIDKRDNLILCEAVRFTNGHSAVVTTLRRAQLAGRVEVGPKARVKDHFADALDEDGDIVETIVLDRHSYSALKNHWMRCKVGRL